MSLLIDTWRLREVRWIGSAAAAGALLGFLWVVLLAGQGAQNVSLGTGDPWEERELPFETLMQILITSEVWGRGPEPVVPEVQEAPPEPEMPERVLPDRPGVFKHLELVAILRSPQLTAVLQPVQMPDAQRSVMLSSQTVDGLYHTGLGEEVASGWEVSGISDTRLEIVGTQSGEHVEYQLFDWQVRAE